MVKIVEIGKYYLLNPIDYGKIIGKCIGFQHESIENPLPIFEFEYESCGKIVKGSNAFSFYAIEGLLEKSMEKSILRNEKLNYLGIK